MNTYMKPRASVRNDCLKWCLNDTRFNCITKDCLLRTKNPILARIKAFCASCACDFKAWECDGIVLNVDKKVKCPLHQYRMGKNRNLKRGSTPEHLKEFQFKKGV